MSYTYKDLPRPGAAVTEIPLEGYSYSYDPKLRQFNSYDTPAIAQFKAEYVQKNGLAGSMFWDVSTIPHIICQVHTAEREADSLRAALDGQKGYGFAGRNNRGGLRVRKSRQDREPHPLPRQQVEERQGQHGEGQRCPFW